MLTLEEAIEKYKRDEKVYRILAHHNNSSYVPKKIADEYKQLAAWLRELQERRKAPEIIFCHECRYWKDSDGVYRRGISAESKCPVNSRQVYEGTFFCGDAERRTE